MTACVCYNSLNSFDFHCLFDIGLCSSFIAVSSEQQECRLTIHWENGFTLSSSPSYDDSNLQVIWHYPFEKLRMSSDDGKHLLWLDFGEDDGEKVCLFSFSNLSKTWRHEIFVMDC